jgi:hypothetical protein
VLQEIAGAFRLLASHPEAGHFRGDLTPLPVKFRPVFSYLIVYDPAARPLPLCGCCTAGRMSRRSLAERRNSKRRAGATRHPRARVDCGGFRFAAPALRLLLRAITYAASLCRAAPFIIAAPFSAIMIVGAPL